jgi:coenzyme F420-0:L-glutamate ligase
MELIAIKTPKLSPPKIDLPSILDAQVPELFEGDILLITSKIVAIGQGRCLPLNEQKKDQLIIAESDYYLSRTASPQNVLITIKGNTLIPSSGIDESNSNGYYILWPQKPNKEAQKIREQLKTKFKLSNLGVIITDSHCVPLRRGTIGIAIGSAGLKVIKDERGSKDLFGRELKVTTSNLIDPLAAMGVMLMGEGAEQTPMAIIREFKSAEFSAVESLKDLKIERDEDIFAPLLKDFKDRD